MLYHALHGADGCRVSVGRDVKDGDQWSEAQSLQRSTDFGQTFAAAKNFPERVRLSSDFAEQKSFGKDDAPRPDRENEQKSQNKPRDRGRLSKDLDQI